MDEIHQRELEPMHELEQLEPPEMRQELDRVPTQPWALFGILAVNLLAWLAMLLSPDNAAGFWGDPSVLHLYHWGALHTPSVVAGQEYWRLITASFIHANWLHLGFNMFFLWLFGRYAIRWYGNLQFLILYLCSALLGAAASLYFGASIGISVGASGAVFGIIAAMLCSTFQHQHRLSSAQEQKLNANYGIFLAIGLLAGFTQPGIDNATHIGGALAGAYMGWFLIERFETGEQRSLSAEQRPLALLPVLLVVVMALVLAPTS